MDKKVIQIIIVSKLVSRRKWGASHTEEKHLLKGLPKHLRGAKEVQYAIEELFKIGFLLRSKKTYEWHVSLNPNKKQEISEFLCLDED